MGVCAAHIKAFFLTARNTHNEATWRDLDHLRTVGTIPEYARRLFTKGLYRAQKKRRKGSDHKLSAGHFIHSLANNGKPANLADVRSLVGVSYIAQPLI